MRFHSALQVKREDILKHAAFNIFDSNAERAVWPAPFVSRRGSLTGFCRGCIMEAVTSSARP